MHWLIGVRYLQLSHLRSWGPPEEQAAAEAEADSAELFAVSDCLNGFVVVCCFELCPLVPLEAPWW